MFKKSIKKSQPNRVRIEPEIDSIQLLGQVVIQVSMPKRKLKAKERSNWFNWSIPLLLISTGIGFLVFYPSVDQQQMSQPKVRNTKVMAPIETIFNTRLLSQELVSRYFNGTDEDQNEQNIALEETLNILHTSTHPQAKKALSELQGSNINAAKKSLIAFASTQSNLQESSQTWINIGNIQNLSSSRQALQAYKKASEIDAENVNAYSRQGHVYQQLKKFDLAEKAYKRVQSFSNQSTVSQALTLANFGVLNVSKGKLVEAEDAFNQSLSIYKRIKNDAGIANISFNLANLYKSSERFEQAESYYKTALISFVDLNKFKKTADTHAALGSLYQSMQLNVKAQNQYQIALELNTNNNFDENKLVIYQSLGELAEENGEIKKAQTYFSKARGVDPNANQDNSVADELGKQAIANRQQRNFLAAEEQHKQAIKIYQQNKSIAGTISQQINLGFLYKVWGKLDLSCLVWRDTLMISKRANSTRTSRVQKLLDSSCQ